jgi:hypothetical protein
MFNAFRQYEKEYIDWIQSSYPETNIFTQDFIANLLEQDERFASGGIRRRRF